MTFHDIRFKGERIIFELGLQEALAVYVRQLYPFSASLKRLPTLMRFYKGRHRSLPVHDRLLRRTIWDGNIERAHARLRLPYLCNIPKYYLRR